MLILKESIDYKYFFINECVFIFSSNWVLGKFIFDIFQEEYIYFILNTTFVFAFLERSTVNG